MNLFVSFFSITSLKDLKIEEFRKEINPLMDQELTEVIYWLNTSIYIINPFGTSDPSIECHVF